MTCARDPARSWAVLQLHKRPFAKLARCLVLSGIGIGGGGSNDDTAALSAAGVAWACADLLCFLLGGVVGVRMKRSVGVFERVVVPRQEAIGARRFFAESVDSPSLRALRVRCAIAKLQQGTWSRSASCVVVVLPRQRARRWVCFAVSVDPHGAGPNHYFPAPT
jgi:hypothetical protein